MSYKLHSIFTNEITKVLDDRLPSIRAAILSGIVKDILYLSRMGVLPEGSSEQEQERVNGTAFVDQIQTSPIPIPPPMPVSVKPASTVDNRQTHFMLSQASKSELQYVFPTLRNCVELAIQYTTIDFRVLEGLRSVEAQRKAVASGNSRTMNSKHLKQSDGFAHAVDLVVLTDNKVDWTFSLYANIALAMDKAATELGIAGHVRWGCAWDRVLSDFGGNPQAYLNEASAYAKRHAGSDLLDAPHFEWVA